MAGYNMSLYLDGEKTWEEFKRACALTGKKPNSVLRGFIDSYCQEVLLKEIPLEKRLAIAIVESEKIARGEIKAKKAEDLLGEL